MRHFRPQQRATRPWTYVLGWLCIALIVFAGTVSVTHHHALGDHSDHDSCSLCATAHAVAQVAAPPVQIALSVVYITVETTLPTLRPRTFKGSASFTRPPPAPLDHA